MKKKEKFAEPWKRYAECWKKELYTPPGRPLAQAEKIYRKFIKKAIGRKKNPSGLILGSTPELRDLLFKMKFKEKVMIDINLEMILAMTEIRRYKDPEEIIVKGNWVSHPLASNHFDLVLGDIVLSNVPVQFQDKFLKEIIKVLKPNGHFITKMEVIPNDWIFEDFDSVLEKYKNIPYSKNRHTEFFCHLHNDAWDSKTKTIYVERIKKWMDKFKIGKERYKHPNKKISLYLNKIWQMWKPMDKQWTARLEKDEEKKVKKYFKILEKFVLSDCYYKEVDQSFPIWFCQAK